MKFFIDTADTKAIAELAQTGLVDGVTTNPSLIMKSGRDFIEVLKEICDLVDGPISGEVVSLDHENMMIEAKKLLDVHKNITIKVPMTWDGLKTCKRLSDQGHMVNVTLCFSANQALLAAKAGARFVSPFVGRVDDMSYDGMALIEEIRQVYDNYAFETEILAASIRTVNHVKDCALIGADVVTIPPEVMSKLISHPLTDKGIESFVSDWKKTGQSL